MPHHFSPAQNPIPPTPSLAPSPPFPVPSHSASEPPSTVAMDIVHTPRKLYGNSPPSATGPFLSRARKVRCPKIKPPRLDEEFASLQIRGDGSGGDRKKRYLSPDSAPSAARAVKRRRFVALVDDEHVGRLESGGAEIRVRVRRATLRKLGDEFDQEAV